MRLTSQNTTPLLVYSHNPTHLKKDCVYRDTSRFSENLQQNSECFLYVVFVLLVKSTTAL